MKNIAVLEISNGHAEILYSQTLFAKTANYNVHLLCNTTHKERVKDFDTATITLTSIQNFIKFFHLYIFIKLM